MDRDEDRFEGRITGPQFEPEKKDSLGLRLIYVILIAVLLYVGNFALGVATIVQFVVMLLNKGEPNERLAEFGESLGIWIAKAARYQTGASEVKPWPWTELD
ncbi:DUF4389 domain-containing protein [Pseudoruegeria sp. HB172150]|uniref:DUF4389 domain-containing protein n=1 Tax=Pseudoruegeria sp. HB172150 TaxID=2721164 RepID=UPI0015542668|nr:DUF4389 domain-containing protein [Pseudoruegeria sp. HB172150]